MMYSRFWSISIMIASALLLTAAGSKAAHVTEPRPSSTQPAAAAGVRANEHKIETARGENVGEGQSPRVATTPVENSLIEALNAVRAEVENAYQQYRADQKSWSSPGVLLQIALVVVGALYSLVAYFQLSAINRQGNITKTAADAAIATARTAEQSMIVAQRAYLYLSGVHLKRLDLQNVQITYPIYNGGQTPGVLIGRFIRVTLVDRIPAENPTGSPATIKEGVVIPPSRGEAAVINPQYFIQLVDGEAEQIEDGRLTFFLYGFLMYVDVFGHWHKTGIGAAYSGPLETGKTYFMNFLTQVGYNYFD